MLILLPVLLLAASALATTIPAVSVNIRIEGSKTTIYEGPIQTRAENVTTPSGGNHLCNGLNGGTNPTPGATCTTALNDASKQAHFPFDGVFETAFDDFTITS